MTFKHKGLVAYWNKGNSAKLPAPSLPRIARILGNLNKLTQPEDANLPGSYYHQLTGRDAGRYSLRVTANWRITFAWDGQQAIDIDIDFVDYH